MKSVFDQLKQAKRDTNYHEEELRKAGQELVDVTSQVRYLAQTAAKRLLVDDQGNPVDGVIHFYSDQAIVRLNGEIHILPAITVGEGALYDDGSDEGASAQ